MQDSRITNVLVALRRVIRATDLHSRELVRSSGLTAPQLLLLQTVKSRTRATVGELAQEMSLSQATVTSILDRMEARKYVSRKKVAEDRRKVYVSLTPLGKMDAHNLDAAPLLDVGMIDR